ncbi:MAG: SDR family oxidoreductase [Abditibacteriota bacterium]|nr:SDR family oxidoreductase [Abditibacteriota bacterium]
MVDYGLTGKTVLITGANNPQGIGAATALAFARQGARVALVFKRVPRPWDEQKTGLNGPDRYYKANAGDAGDTESRLRAAGADCMVIESDISDEERVRDIYARVAERFGRVRVLVNNAAADDETGRDTSETVTGQVIDDTFAVNVRGSLLMIREFIRQRDEGGGRVINVSTDSAQVFAGQITYGASKAALEALTRSIAMETGKYGITVNCVAPGPTQTGWIDADLEKAVIPLIPMGELIRPEDIADAILFLAGDRARMLTGQVIKVSGGHAL